MVEVAVEHQQRVAGGRGCARVHVGAEAAVGARAARPRRRRAPGTASGEASSATTTCTGWVWASELLDERERRRGVAVVRDDDADRVDARRRGASRTHAVSPTPSTGDRGRLDGPGDRLPARCARAGGGGGGRRGGPARRHPRASRSGALPRATARPHASARRVLAVGVRAGVPLVEGDGRGPRGEGARGPGRGVRRRTAVLDLEVRVDHDLHARPAPAAGRARSPRGSPSSGRSRRPPRRPPSARSCRRPSACQRSSAGRA